MIKRVLAVVATTVVLFFGAMAAPAYADEGPGDEANRWYNGCTNVPNVPWGYNFEQACNWHDLCYGQQIEGYDKGSCDRTFHQFMDTICQYNYGSAGSCRFWSATYYAGVGYFGSAFYGGGNTEPAGPPDLPSCSERPWEGDPWWDEFWCHPRPY